MNAPFTDPLRVRPVTVLPVDDFIREALTARIAAMLEDLGNPPLVGRVFPKGWRNADRAGLISLYELCRRTFARREKGND